MEISHIESPLTNRNDGPKADVSIFTRTMTSSSDRPVDRLPFGSNDHDLRAEIERLKNQIRENNSTIRKQQEELERLESIKSRFFSVVSHDLKSPLCGLSGFVNMILENIDDFSKKEICRFVKQLKDSIDGTIQLSDDLITWAQAQMKNFGVHPEIIHPKDIIQNVFDVCDASASKKGIRLSSDIKDQMVLYGDKNQLTFIIRNLVSNAIKFSYSGGTVKVCISENDFGDSVIRIQDTGVGISEPDMHQLFNSNHKSTLGTSGEKGTGMGLMLVREFVEMHGGQIEAFSRKGQGSTFKITLNPLTLNQKLLAI